MPLSKIKESRAHVKQLEYEIERLEWLQPDALSAVRFHRFDKYIWTAFEFCVCLYAGSIEVSDGRSESQTLHINYWLMTFFLDRAIIPHFLVRSTITNGWLYGTSNGQTNTRNYLQKHSNGRCFHTKMMILLIHSQIYFFC